MRYTILNMMNRRGREGGMGEGDIIKTHFRQECKFVGVFSNFIPNTSVGC